MSKHYFISLCFAKYFTLLFRKHDMMLIIYYLHKDSSPRKIDAIGGRCCCFCYFCKM